MKKIAVFDSGVGGLTVVKSLIDNNLFEEIIYYGDSARVPYGTKDPNTIIRYCLEALEFFENFDVEMLIVACNSASAYGLKDLQEKAHFPVVGVIEPGVKSVEKLGLNKNDKILIIGTKATINSNTYQERLKEDGYTNIDAIATSLFVSIVEEGLYSSSILNETMKHYFQFQEPPQAIILACTHFPLIAQDINSYFPNAHLIHSGEAIVEYLQEGKLIETQRKSTPTKLKLFASEGVANLKKVAKKWL